MEFVSWETLGVVKLQYVNNATVTARLSDFTIIWGNIEVRAGISFLDLGRVTIGGSSPADPLTLPIWTGPDGDSPTGGRGEGTWHGDYLFQPRSVTPVYLDFDGTNANLQVAFGAQISDFNGTNFVITEDCGDAAGGTAASDGRLNPAFGDHFAVVYPSDGAGNPALRIYRVDADSRGWLALAVDVDDLPAVEAMHQLVAQGDGVAVYLLNTGEIQINLGPDAAGKMFTLIVDGLPPTRVQRQSS
jgi:hypothetical protein